MGAVATGEIDRRIQEQLIAQRRRTAIAGEEARDRREIAAGAVAADGKPIGVDAEGRSRLGDPSGGGETILDRGREFVFGAKR